FFGGLPGSPATPSLSAVTVINSPVGDNFLDPGDPVDVTFSLPLARFGGGTLRVAYFNKDLDGSGTIGDALGELGYSGAGFAIRPREPVSEPGTQFTLVASTYASRWQMLYTGSASIPATTPVTIDFTRQLDPSSGAQSVWGVPMRSSTSTTLTVSR